jgi:predicted Zn finger-like uncharacterized protein
LPFARRRVPCAHPMTVECPRCGTLYRRPTRAEPGADATYRCARCRHVFDAGADEPAMLSADPEEHEFAFDDEPEDGDAPPVAVAHDIAPEEEERPMKSPARFAVRTMLVVTLGFGVLSVYLYTNPDGVRTAFGRVPLIGSRLAEEPLYPAAVQLTDVKGGYERVQGDRLVFVISGTALNNSPVPARSIQIEGRIAGAQEQRQVVFCGAAPRDVKDLSLREIALLQTLEPPKDWALAPGEQADFLVVFASPPTDLREFGAEVVAVQAPSRRG